MEVSQAEFAKMCGVSRMAINKKVRSKYKPLVVNSAGLIDTDNIVNRDYLARKTGAFASQMAAAAAGLPVPECPVPDPAPEPDPQAAAAPAQRPGRPPLAVPSAAPRPGVILPDQLKRMTLGEILAKFGNVDNAEKYIKMLKDLTLADEKEFNTRIRRQDFIKKEFVTSKVFVFIDQLMNQLLDLPESVVDQIISLVLSDSSAAKPGIVLMLRDNLSRCISGAKDSILHEFAGLKSDSGPNAAETLEQIQSQLEEMRNGNGG
ncbi:MAG: hypothetical protein IKT97_00360 [Spirochaetia bacterium]|nr:hypothetical protein [Spirochaetia bacterium]